MPSVCGYNAAFKLRMQCVHDVCPALVHLDAGSGRAIYVACNASMVILKCVMTYPIGRPVAWRPFASHDKAAKTTFDPERDIPDLSGKVVIVTGGNTGIGKETVKALLRKNAKVYLAARSSAKAEEAINDLKAETGKEALFLELDLASLDKTVKAAKEFQNKETELHILFNSGGVLAASPEQLTEDGYDLQFGTNCLGHAHFTLCLIDQLIAGAKSSPDGKARVVNTSSSVVYWNAKPRIEWLTLADRPERKKRAAFALYIQSKSGVIAFSNELAKRYADKGILSNAVNPGNIKTDLQRNLPSFHYRHLLNLVLLYPAPMGALPQLYVGTMPQAADVNGGWFIPWARQAPHDSYTRDPQMEEALWQWIKEQRQGHF